MTTQLTDKERYLIGLAEEWWDCIRTSEIEEMLDKPQWKDHFPGKSRDEVRGLISGEVSQLLSGFQGVKEEELAVTS